MKFFILFTQTIRLGTDLGEAIGPFDTRDDALSYVGDNAGWIWKHNYQILQMIAP